MVTFWDGAWAVDWGARWGWGCFWGCWDVNGLFGTNDWDGEGTVADSTLLFPTVWEVVPRKIEIMV